MARKKLEMENNSCSTGAKLSELTDDHAVEQNGNRLGAVRKHVQDTNGRETDIRMREIWISFGNGLARGERKNFRSKTQYSGLEDGLEEVGIRPNKTRSLLPQGRDHFICQSLRGQITTE